MGANPNDKQIRGHPEDDRRRAFGPGKAMVSEMKVRAVFKGVTYQSLQDKDFIALAQASFPHLSLLEEHEAAPRKG